MLKNSELPTLGFLYMDYVLRFFDYSNFKGWPNKIEAVTYHWKNDKERFIKEVKRKKIDVLIGNVPATAYETFREISKALPNVRFVPSLETQFPNKSKENVTLFCEKYDISHPKTEIFYDVKEGYEYLKTCSYPKIVKKSYGASNYGGYFVHKVDNAQEAKELFDKEKYVPMYIQDAVELKDSGDLRVMLIGHKPICAFWRYSGEGEWITNTSQGGDMSYENVPLNALELAVKASKAAKAEYWASDIAIDAKTGEATILECATAFAAFPYIRDWICQYLMWDFSEGRFQKPHVPLFSWEELGKIDPALLRTMRHIGFGKYSPSADGEYFYDANEDEFDMEKALESKESDLPDPIAPLESDKLPEVVKEQEREGATNKSILSSTRMLLQNITLTDLMSLHGMEEEIAVAIVDYTKTNAITSLDNLLDIEGIDQQDLVVWGTELSTQVDVNNATAKDFAVIDGVNDSLSEAIVEDRERNGMFNAVEELARVKGLGKKKLDSILTFLRLK